ncbi:FAD dependent oxidoreductase [Protomyces lactucae-debilis]|uniref:L-2-hydroxyglutarate dehydrogenase, mitochondrial n=1 Tax=Protomyces lactucae-debilis TaxID=2754530 RepID=A0A1Y2ES74_PROLT|nr:FAD dependent oxidoreductase [Protomyces lactucae-debilis]ORY74134.1 FAD dependent oxidoreductase [Protomyces lactucae-debilis]
MDFSHVVVGGGVVGLAVASRLARAAASNSVLLIERNRQVGQETSSRNSEVIHAGLYYPLNSLKTELCIKGKSILYELFDKQGIDYKRCGKWIVAQNADQAAYLDTLRNKADQLGVPTRTLSAKQAQVIEPHVRADECVLESTSTGIMDSHGLMTYLLGQFENAGGDVSLATKVDRIDAIAGGYKLSTTSAGEAFDIKSESVINCAGLYAVDIANMILKEQLKAYYAKGQYYAYAGGPVPKHLIYPCPEKHLAGLGTHLTFDLAGQIRFGPDIEWVDSPADLSASDARLDEVYKAVQQFFPSLERSRLTADYCGIRPKMAPKGSAATDFEIRHEPNHPGFVNLLGIESPGLTSCLAIAEHVEGLLK